MMLERHEKDKNGYALVVVDAKYKGNLISRVSHSCSPNAKVVVVASDGVYKIGLYALRDINGGEEITFDYFCRTDNKNEMEEAVCLCGTENCRGSFLIFSEDFSDLILKKKHNLYDRIIILLKCSLVKKISQNDLQKLKMGRFRK
ncbi:hypothetical protein MHBO_004510 [Bonamia ostreae]|uniref:Uncharacterized protein n=1 Tax=Bonamia ostreae TaxID=126728 RepID=A0ABV2ATH6_9EUKA